MSLNFEAQLYLVSCKEFCQYPYVSHSRLSCVFHPRSWPDAVLWNPHLQMEACYKDFVCVENAKVQISYFLISK